MTYQELKTAIQKKKYKFFDFGDWNINIIFVRTNDQFTDFFTDKSYIAYRENGIEKVLEQPCSTKAGLYYVNNPITYQKVTGVAVIIPGQYQGVYELIDDYTTWLKYPFFKQIAPMSYWRDFDKDTTLDKVQPQINKMFGTHYHRGSNIGATGRHNYNWSAGCIIQEEPYFKKVIEIARKAAAKYGNKFTITILDQTDL